MLSWISIINGNSMENQWKAYINKSRQTKRKYFFRWKCFRSWAFGIEGLSNFFRAQAFGEALRKDRDCSAEKGNDEEGKKLGRGQAAGQEKAQPSPASSRNVDSLASHVHGSLWQTFRRRRPRKEKRKVCRRFIRGNCKAKNCLFSHEPVEWPSREQQKKSYPLRVVFILQVRTFNSVML